MLAIPDIAVFDSNALQGKAVDLYGLTLGEKLSLSFCGCDPELAS
jgi:hypothetical protein